MTRPPQQSEDSIFAAALSYSDVATRTKYLAEACGNDGSLRARIEDLLYHHAQASAFLEDPPAGLAPTVVTSPIHESPGTVIGPYRLLAQIGEGGFGVVFNAEQTSPVRRHVALKVIKPGMDTRQVIARFEAERQALALMDHPNIAKVLDGGTTPTGRPYFVMELVNGRPITEYCDEHQLSPRERLQLFLTVCHAVQHAHQKGIIHRDIKPSNILVTQHDDQPVVKVIDFGVAKAISGPLTDKTLFTGFAQMIGTPLYMSPEQAALSGVNIDTRSDIYSLGVLLYELLTGTTPFDRARLKEAAFDEIRRIIREEEPLKPSTRLSELSRADSVHEFQKSSTSSSSSGPASLSLASIAALRKMEPRRLSQLIKGDLDWIVMKALEKDRTRRYESANGFALDVMRYLHDEPVLACPPSAAYRFSKFARRNKATLATVAMVALALVAGIIGMTWQAIRATHEADRANKAETIARGRYAKEKSARLAADAARRAERKQRNIAILQKARAEAALADVEREKLRAEANFEKARRAVDAYLMQITQNELLVVPGMQPLRENLLQEALRFYSEFTRERANDLALQHEMGLAHYRIGQIYSELRQFEAAQDANQLAISLFEQLRDREPIDLGIQLELGRAYFASRRYDDTIIVCRRMLETDPAHPDARTLLADSYNSIAAAAAQKNNVEESFKYYQQAFTLRHALAMEFPNDARRSAELGGTMNNLGNLLSKQRKNAEALAMYERAVGYIADAYDRAPHSILWGEWLWISLRNVAQHQMKLDQQQQALNTFQRLLDVSQKRAFENPAVSGLHANLYNSYSYLAHLQQQLGMSGEAARCYRRARDVLENMPRDTPEQIYQLATVYAVLMQPSSESTDMTPEDADERKHYSDLAVQTLREAIQAGFMNAQALQFEKALDPLRERDDFKQLASTLAKSAEAGDLANDRAGTNDQQLVSRQRAVEILRELDGENAANSAQQVTLAATLQSMGEIQTGLQQFVDAEKSFTESIALWRQLSAAPNAKPQLTCDRIRAEISLGELCVKAGRAPDAHRIWQAALAELEQLRLQHADDETFANLVAQDEYQICMAYAAIGEFSIAANYSRRNLQLKRIRVPVWELDAAIALAIFDGEDALRAICRQVDEMRIHTGYPSWTPGELRNLGKVSNLLNPPALPAEQTLEWIEKVARGVPNDWHMYLWGLAQHRAGKSTEGFATLEKVIARSDYYSLKDVGARLSTAFAGAIVAHGAGKVDLARERLHQSEAMFVQYCRQMLERPEVGLAPPFDADRHWWEVTAPVLLRREAWRVIGDGTVADESWLRLIEARADQLLGDTIRRDEHLKQASSSIDINVWLARREMVKNFGSSEQLLEDAWQGIVDSDANNATRWIERGHWYAERGEKEKASADFARAASLTPNELNKFLAAGWWVIGPYPADLDEFCPPEIIADPSQPLRVFDPTAGVSREPVAWRHFQAQSPEGLVFLPDFGPFENRSHYALTYIHAPSERTATLWLDEDVRVWVNGTLLEQSTAPTAWHWGAHQRFPCVLRAGKNTILIKQRTGSFFNARLGDNPYDQGLEFFRFGLFSEAAERFAQARNQDALASRSFRSAYLDRFYAVSQLMEGNLDEYRYSASQIAEHFRGTAVPDNLENVVIAGCHGPDGMDPSSLAVALETWNQHQPLNTRPWLRVQIALAEYRVGHFTKVFELLEQVQDDPAACVVQAMAHYRLGHTEEAEARLEQARAYAEGAFENADRLNVDYVEWPTAIYREASRLIRGESSNIEARYANFREVRLRMWQEREPPLADYIDAIRAAPAASQVYVARAIRFAELGRAEDASADFDRAVELAPSDVKVLLARGRFQAKRGNVDQAWTDFTNALSISIDNGDVNSKRLVESEMGLHDNVLNVRLQSEVEVADVWRIRAEWQVRHGKWQEALQGLQNHRSHWSYEMQVAPLCCLLGDAAGYQQSLDRSAKINAEFPRDFDWQSHRMLLLALQPVFGDDAAELCKVLEAQQAKNALNRAERAHLGIALHRCGRFEEALTLLAECLRVEDQWQTSALVWPVLAMTHARLGHADEAQQWLDRSIWWSELLQCTGGHPGAFGPHGISYSDYLCAHVFQREAVKMILGENATPFPEQRGPLAPERKESR